MCIVFLSLGCHPGYKVIVLDNRDEVFGRPTSMVSEWEGEDIIAGRDLIAQGTWFGITKTGRWGVLTNIKCVELDPKEPNSRGSLIVDFLRGTETPYDYCLSLKKNSQSYAGFNIIVGHLDNCCVFSNREIFQAPIELMKKEVYGLSNHLIDYPWPKVLRGKRFLKEFDVRPFQNKPTELIHHLFHILLDTEKVSDISKLQKDSHDINELKARSSIFIEPIEVDSSFFGTRSSAVLLIEDDNTVHFCERALTEDNEWKESYMSFKVPI